MESETVVSALAHFFNDFVGSVVPGLVLFSLFVLLHPGLWEHAPQNIDLENAMMVLAIVGICFAGGHGLLGLYFGLIERLIRNIHWSRSHDGTERFLVRDENTILGEAKGQLAFLTLERIIKEKFGPISGGMSDTSSSFSPHEVRNIAMTLSEKSAALGRRLMFIALLGCGTGTAFAVMALLTAFEDIAFNYFSAKSFLIQYSVWWGLSAQFLLLLSIALVFFRRGDEFLYRSLVAPFSVALVEITVKPAAHEGEK